MYVYPNANKKMYYYFLKAWELEEKRTFAVVYWEKFREFLQRTRPKISAKISEMRKKKTRGPKAGKVHIKTPANQMPQSTHTETIQTFTDTRAGDTEELTPQSLGVPLSAVATGATIPSVAVQDAAANT